MRFEVSGRWRSRSNAPARGALAGVVVVTGAVAVMAVIMSAALRADPGRAPGTCDGTSHGDTLVVLDEFPLPMTAGKWRQGSVPSVPIMTIGEIVAISTSILDVPGTSNAETHWYSPQGVVKAYDLDPDLSDARGALNDLQVLALSIPRRPVTAPPSDSLWASLTYPLDVAGLDFSRAQFIDVWVNDWRDQVRVRDPGVKLHIDFGVVSEDQMRAPDQPPNNMLDSEDLEPRDQQLVPAEDTGVDGVGDAAGDGRTGPLDLSTATPADPAGDDYGAPLDPYGEMDPRRWVRSNGTEANRSVMPLPDTEDLNLDNNLSRQEDYYAYTIDLSDGVTPYLVTDVYAEFAGKAVPHPPAGDNGWRLYRVPIDAAERLQFGAPDLHLARHVRVWIQGVLSPDGAREGNPEVMRPLLVLGGIFIAGEVPSPKPVAARAALRSWPNPARQSVTIALASPGPQRVDLTVYDLGGRRVRRLSQGTLDAGTLRFNWNGRDDDGARVEPGVYFVEARGPDFTSFTRVVFLE